jgi:hypothetical protein
LGGAEVEVGVFDPAGELANFDANDGGDRLEDDQEEV